jgi:hypothetical protein
MEFGDYLIEVLKNDEGEFVARVNRKDGRHFKDRVLFPFEELTYAETMPHATREEAIEEAKALVAASKPLTQHR